MLGEVDFAGVGFVDTLFRAGAFGLAPPFISGIEVAGRVRELGAGMDGFRVGQPVAALPNDFGRGSRAGGYAEVAVARAGMVTAVPEREPIWLVRLPCWSTVSPRGSSCTPWRDSRPATMLWYWAPVAASAAPPAGLPRFTRLGG